MKNYPQGKILFRDTKWLLSNMSYRGHDDQAVWACTVGHTTWLLHYQLASWKAKKRYSFFVVRGCETFWNLQTNEGSVWRQLFESGECMNGWKDFETDDKMSVMNTGVGDQLAWQVRQWNSRWSSESVTRGESLLMKLLQHSTWVMALHTILSIMTLGIGKCVADGSQGSCPMITSVQGRQFIKSIWTVMLMKEMLFSIELWQETGPGCTIMNQRVRDNRCSGSTRRLWPTKNSRHRLLLEKSCWPSFGMSMALYRCIFRKGSNCD